LTSVPKEDDPDGATNFFQPDELGATLHLFGYLSPQREWLESEQVAEL
jgi:hypothetical protein